MEVFVQFIKDNIWLVVMVAIAVVGIIAIGTILIINKIRTRNDKKPDRIVCDESEKKKSINKHRQCLTRKHIGNFFMFLMCFLIR